MSVSFKKLVPAIYIFVILLLALLMYFGIGRDCRPSGLLVFCIPESIVAAIFVSTPGMAIFLPIFSLLPDTFRSSDQGIQVLAIGLIIFSFLFYLAFGMLLDYVINKPKK